MTLATARLGSKRIRLSWNGVRSLLVRLEAMRERARQRRQLAMLDDRMLKDIGLSRADVAREADKPVWLP